MMEQPQRDEALEAYFESMKALSEDNNFKILLAELVEQSISINSVEDVRPSTLRTLSEETAFRQGQLNVIRTLESMRNRIDILEKDYLDSLEPEKGNPDSEGLYVQ